MNLDRLTPRQLAIFERIGQGMQWKRIAAKLGITEGTVKSQAYLIYRKLGCSSRVEVIRFCAARDAKGDRNG